MVEQNPEGAEKKSFFGINREIRLVPLNWQHPKDPNGDYIPLLSRTDKNRFTSSEIKDMQDEGMLTSPEEIETLFMPDFSSISEDQMGICAYEAVTKGTPISPVFPNTPTGRFELVKYCSDNAFVFADRKAPDIEVWFGILFGSTAALFNVQEGTIEFPLPPQKP